jgi:hypothetical protein
MNESKITSADSIKLHLHYLDHFLRVEQNEETQSEQIIKFFLAFITGTIAIISIFNNSDSNGLFNNENYYVVLVVFLSFAFLLELFVFARVIWSDRKIKQHRKLWDESYNAIKDIDQSVIGYQIKLKQMNDNNICKPLRMFKGTLTQIIWFTESFIFALLLVVLSTMFQCQLICRILLIIIPTACVLLLLKLWASYIKQGVNS